MTSTRKPPHCKACHRPLKGHKRGVCNIVDSSSVLTSPSSLPLSARNTQRSAPLPLETVPTLSPQSSQILNDLLRANSFSVPPIQIPEIRSEPPRRSRRTINGAKPPQDALNNFSADDETKQEVHNKNDAAGGRKELERSFEVDLEQSKSIIFSQTTVIPSNGSCTVSQQLVVRAAKDELLPDPLAIALSRQLQLENSTRSECDGQHQLQVGLTEVASFEATLQRFLDNMSRCPQHPPATIFSFPSKGTVFLEEMAKSRGLCMHVLSLPSPESKWIPVVVGRDTDAITKLLEDGEKLAQGLSGSDKSNVKDLKLGMSHVLVGALGALAMWAGLAYS